MAKLPYDKCCTRQDRKSLIPNCPKNERGAKQYGWCYEGRSKWHCDAKCYRSWGHPRGGQQCCYDDDGNLVTDPCCAGTIDVYGPSGGDCGFNAVRIDNHFRIDVCDTCEMGELYIELQCCLAMNDVPTGPFGAANDPIKWNDLCKRYKACKREVLRGKKYCWMIQGANKKCKPYIPWWCMVLCTPLGRNPPICDYAEPSEN